MGKSSKEEAKYLQFRPRAINKFKRFQKKAQADEPKMRSTESIQKRIKPHHHSQIAKCIRKNC